MAGLGTFLLGPLLYLAVMSAAGMALNPLETTVEGKVAAGAVGAILAVLALARSGRVWMGRDRAVRIGLLALLGVLALGGPSERQVALAPAHAALVLLAGAGLGEAFAAVVSDSLAEGSVLVTAAICLALFDAWSVLFGPAASAVSGGFLQRLLLEVPAPGGPQRFIGISDLVVIALLANLGRIRGWGTARALVAGVIGLELALAQALLTRHAAPALPSIGLAFCIAYWKEVRPDAAGWRRTGRWSVGTGIALGLLTVALEVARHRP